MLLSLRLYRRSSNSTALRIGLIKRGRRLVSLLYRCISFIMWHLFFVGFKVALLHTQNSDIEQGKDVWFPVKTSFLPSNFPVICVLVGYERKGFLPGQHFRYTVDARNEIIIVVFFKSNASWNAYDWLPSGETMSITRRRWCNIDCTTESNCFQSKVLCSFDGFKMRRFVLAENAQKREHIGTWCVTWKGFRLADFECLGLCPKENEWNG